MLVGWRLISGFSVCLCWSWLMFWLLSGWLFLRLRGV